MSSAAPAKSNPLPGTISTIKGYPDRLKIYQVAGSPYWWCRATFGERRITRTTRELDRPKAVAFAKHFYESLLQNNGAVPLNTSRSFERCANSLLDEHRQRTAAAERNPRFADDLRKQLTHRILPFFKSYTLKDINYAVIGKFVDSMRKDGCSASTIQRNLVSVRQVLKHAIKHGLIDALPVFPVISTRDNPRPWFNQNEYDTLKKVAAAEVKKGLVIKGEPLTEEARDFILFMVNTFLRPSDWYNLKRKQIRVEERKKEEEPLLVISPASSKTTNTAVISMPAAVGIYHNIVSRQDSTGRLSGEAYLFLPHIVNRGRARDLMRRFFDHIIRAAGLKTAHTGSDRTIYSLRHTAIAFRLLNGENVDLLFLARNCRTSVDMLDRFYCRHLSALMAPEKIVGLKSRPQPSNRT